MSLNHKIRLIAGTFILISLALAQMLRIHYRRFRDYAWDAITMVPRPAQ